MVLQSPAWAEDSGASTSFPVFLTLKSSEINLRDGPGKEYPIVWIYRYPGLPVKIVREYNFWFYVCDPDGSKGWIHRSLLGKKNTIMVLAPRMVLYTQPCRDAPPLAHVERGVIGSIIERKDGWVRIVIPHEKSHYSGWALTSDLWGVAPLMPPASPLQRSRK